MAQKHIVSLAECKSYDHVALRGALDQLFSHIGGIRSFVSAGQNVLIKPNLLTDRTPAQAVTTHPELVRAVIKMVREAGANPSVADSPASAVKTSTVWKTTGYEDMCREENVPLINLEEAGSVEVNKNGFQMHISRPVLEADVVINMPKVKTHILTLLTAAVKNLYGTLPGYQKANLHKQCPKQPHFAKLLRTLHQQVKPTINIADGILGMEGNGPSGGNPVELGFLAASTDAIALDMVICRILKMKPSAVPYLAADVSHYSHSIEIKGASPDEMKPDSFKLPSTLAARLVPGWIVNLINPFLWIRPQIDDKCIACRRCVEACPVNALEINKDLKKAVLTPDKCIGCCCCHEICPENAIEMGQSPLLNFLRKGKK